MKAAILAFLALAGLAAADDALNAISAASNAPAAVPAAVPAPSPLTAWQFINFAAELGEDSNLTRVAALLEELGLAAGLDQPFSGTLLLPNNAAWEEYVDGMDYIPTPDPSGGRSDSIFWLSLIRYHVLTSVVALTNLASGTRLTTKHTKEPGRRHMLQYFPDTNGKKALMMDEIGVGANIVLKDNMVAGGGFINIINGVLQPDDLFKSLSALLNSKMELSYTTELLKQLGMQTLWSDRCMWISETAYSNQAYEDIPQASSDYCVPCWQTSSGCGNNYTYDLPDGAYGYDYSFPTAVTESQSQAKAQVMPAAFEDLVDVAVRVDRALAAGTLMIERYSGTFLLPSDTAYINGLPDDIDPEIWEPIVQNHFVSAGASPVPVKSRQLMGYDSKRSGGFPDPRTRRSFLGQMRNDRTYTQSYTATRTGCGINRRQPCLKIQYPALASGRQQPSVTNILVGSLNLQTPGHFYHIIDKTMVPPCYTKRECIKPFTQQP